MSLITVDFSKFKRRFLVDMQILRLAKRPCAKHMLNFSPKIRLGMLINVKLMKKCIAIKPIINPTLRNIKQ